MWLSMNVFSRTCSCNMGGGLDRSTSAGAITQFTLPSGGTRRTAAVPRPITSGPDGALWYGDFKLGQVGRMTTAGALTTFKVPQGAPAGITSGLDGNLWLTANFGTAAFVYRLTTGGTFTAFAVPADGMDGVSLGPITLGPDGNLWFADYDVTTSRGSIVRIRTSGSQTRFVFPTGTEVDGLASGPDGALWFTAVDRFDANTPKPFVGRMAAS
jgi:virginiamycin B lyase